MLDLKNALRSHSPWLGSGFALLLMAAFFSLLAANEADPGTQGVREFRVRGVVTRLQSDEGKAIIRHEAIPDYMPAMTMPFRLRNPKDLERITVGDDVVFRLVVTADESAIDQVEVTSHAAARAVGRDDNAPVTNAPVTFALASIPAFALTNEFGQPIRFSQFQGSAVALTFFFTRCPIPEYCPRLSKSFAGAAKKLQAAPHGPTNWQLLSISFDPLDTPSVLRAYARQYGYDSNHWTFITGRPEHVRELTSAFGLSVTPAGSVFAHDFRTVIFNASGHLRTVWPFGGDTSEALAAELTKAALATNGVPRS